MDTGMRVLQRLGLETATDHKNLRIIKGLRHLGWAISRLRCDDVCRPISDKPRHSSTTLAPLRPQLLRRTLLRLGAFLPAAGFPPPPCPCWPRCSARNDGAAPFLPPRPADDLPPRLTSRSRRCTSANLACADSNASPDADSRPAPPRRLRPVASPSGPCPSLTMRKLIFWLFRTTPPTETR